MEREALPDQTVTVKGSPIRSLLKFIDDEMTEAERDELHTRLPREVADRVAGPILATGTIPVSMLNQLTIEAAAVKGEPIQQFARRAGRAAASEAFNGVYRVFALVLTPEKLLGKAARIWGSLYSRGELLVESRSDKSAHIKLLDFPSEEAGCARVTGWIERMTELTGVRNPRILQTRCYAKGAPACEWDIHWE
jgi:predicted hydrocarbon binding protein